MWKMAMFQALPITTERNTLECKAIGFGVSRPKLVLTKKTICTAAQYVNSGARAICDHFWLI